MTTVSESPRPLRYWLSAWGPVALAVGIIAIESTRYFGAERTSGPLRWIFERIFWPVSDHRWERLHHLIRKSGHFVGYGTVGLTWLRAWWMTLPKSGFLQDAFLALLGTAVVAGSDEFHQSFLPNRTGVPTDVLLDCCGAITLLLLVYFVLRLFRPQQLSRAE